MASYKYDNLKIVGVHVPDYSREVGPNGDMVNVELPGSVQFGVVVEGGFVPLTTVKKSTLDTIVERAQADRQEQAGEQASQDRASSRSPRK